jgi:hypothetical protein
MLSNEEIDKKITQITSALFRDTIARCVEALIKLYERKPGVEFPYILPAYDNDMFRLSNPEIMPDALKKLETLLTEGSVAYTRDTTALENKRPRSTGKVSLINESGSPLCAILKVNGGFYEEIKKVLSRLRVSLQPSSDRDDIDIGKMRIFDGKLYINGDAVKLEKRYIIVSKLLIQRAYAFKHEAGQHQYVSADDVVSGLRKKSARKATVKSARNYLVHVKNVINDKMGIEIVHAERSMGYYILI